MESRVFSYGIKGGLLLVCAGVGVEMRFLEEAWLKIGKPEIDPLEMRVDAGEPLGNAGSGESFRDLGGLREGVDPEKP